MIYKKVYLTDVEQYLSQGWVKGRKIKRGSLNDRIS